MRDVGWQFLFGGFLLLHTAQKTEDQRGRGPVHRAGATSSQSAPRQTVSSHGTPSRGLGFWKISAPPGQGFFLEAQRSTASLSNIANKDIPWIDIPSPTQSPMEESATTNFYFFLPTLLQRPD